HIKGSREYELTNHLGNVLTVVSDRRLGVTIGNVLTYNAEVLSATDYYAFGMPMPGRVFNGGTYRYGYSGMEMDNELKNFGNSYTSEFRQYDPRLGRWMTMDPEWRENADISPYANDNNNPIVFTDPNGDQFFLGFFWGVVHELASQSVMYFIEHHTLKGFWRDIDWVGVGASGLLGGLDATIPGLGTVAGKIIKGSAKTLVTSTID